MRIEFFVPGKPCQQGSKRYLGRGVMVETNKGLKAWRTDIRAIAMKYFPTPIEGPVTLCLAFSYHRPKSHLTAAGALRKGYHAEKTSAPDLDKLARAVGDALTGVAYRDDAQIVCLRLMKGYDLPIVPNGEGVHITISC